MKNVLYILLVLNISLLSLYTGIGISYVLNDEEEVLETNNEEFNLNIDDILVIHEFGSNYDIDNYM